MLTLGNYSLGVGDRFAHQAKAQPQTLIKAAQNSVDIVPVWNKSHREHTTIGSQPVDKRQADDRAVRELEWECSYYIDADHITFDTVDHYLATSFPILQPSQSRVASICVVRH